MKTPQQLIRPAVLLTVLSTAIAAFVTPSQAAIDPNLTNGLVAYYPLDNFAGGSTPDLVNGYDMVMQNLNAGDLLTGYTGYNAVASGNAGYANSKCFKYTASRSTALKYVANPSDALPINQWPQYTFSMWV